MKIQHFLILFVLLSSIQAFAQKGGGDPVGKPPGEGDGDHIVSFDELLNTLGSKLYDADKNCAKKNNRKINDKNFWSSYSTLLAFLQQKEDSLQPKSSSCDENCNVSPDKVDKYFRCLLDKNGIRGDMQHIINRIDEKDIKDKSKSELEMREFFNKLIIINEQKKS
jgi:hypothetical protein